LPKRAAPSVSWAPSRSSAIRIRSTGATSTTLTWSRWDAIEELGVRIGFHPTGQSSLRDDVARRYLDTPNGRVIGVAGRNPVELMMAFGSMAAGGGLERHPRLRCAFLEGTCGWLPWYLWRLDEAWEKFGPGSEVQISQLPSQYSSGSASSRPTPTRSRSA